MPAIAPPDRLLPMDVGADGFSVVTAVPVIDVVDGVTIKKLDEVAVIFCPSQFVIITAPFSTKVLRKT